MGLCFSARSLMNQGLSCVKGHQVSSTTGFIAQFDP